jgi:hypothetical protein
MGKSLFLSVKNKLDCIEEKEGNTFMEIEQSQFLFEELGDMLVNITEP